MTKAGAAELALAAGVRAIVAGIRAETFGPADILAAHRRRLEQTADLAALVQPCDAAAVAAATSPATGSAVPTLGGVPVSVKDCFPVRGLATTLGIPARRGSIDDVDADLVTRLRRAGAILVGKSNVPEAMYLHETVNTIWGRSNHPLDSRRNPGGSTGGDAALVAAGVVPLAIGNDLAGSLRQPAHACGIAALVPRYVALGDGGAVDTMPGLTLVRPRAGFLARWVDDLAVAVEATVGPAAGAAAGSPRRVAWWDETGPVPPSPAVRRAVREAVAILDHRGIETVQVPATIAREAAWLMLGILSADGGAEIRSLYGGRRPMPGVRRLLAIAGFPPGWRPVLATVLRAIGRRIEAEGVLRTGWRNAAGRAALAEARDRLASRCTELLAGCDAAVCPVSAVPAMRHGAGGRLVVAAGPCLLANLLDLAAGAVPVTTVRADEERCRPPSLDPVLRAAAATDRESAGLPVGVQVIAAPGRDEATVLTVMRLIEASRPDAELTSPRVVCDP